MTENVEQRTGKEKQVWPVPIQMRPVLRNEEEADDDEETEEGDVETAHREREKRNYF